MDGIVVHTLSLANKQIDYVVLFFYYTSVILIGMSNGVQFDEDNTQYVRSSADLYMEKAGFLENLVMKTGIVSTKEQAKYVFIAVIIICLATTVFVLARSSRPASPPIPKGVLQNMQR